MRGLTMVWQVFYWTAFVMCWAVLPLLMNYVQTGEFTVQGKIKRAVKEQARYYLIIGSIGIVLLIYLWFKNAFERYHNHL
jgi:predicted RND superfamily exporter protein